MQHALLIGAPDDDPRQPLDPSPSLAAIAGLLGELGGWSLTRIEGPDADRAGILAGLAALERAVGPDDACLLYFFGHGGVVEIADVPEPLGGRPVFYLVPAQLGARGEFEAIFDIELSLALARIDAVCANVSVILDCCHAAKIVRGPPPKLSPSPAWVHELAKRCHDGDALLAPESHPRIVRLTASSSLRWAYADGRTDGHLGRLTGALVEIVREATPEVDRLTWDALTHRIREQAIWRLGCEDQWVTLAGPRERLLFSRRSAAVPGTVAFVPHEAGDGGWIRAGAVQGVELGDEWGLATLTLDAQLRPRWRARMRVSAVELNRAALVPIGERREPLPPGTSASLLRARTRRSVIVDGPEPLRVAVDDSSLIAPASATQADAFATLRQRDHSLEVASHIDDPRIGELAPVELPGDAQAIAIDLLEDWTRSLMLLALIDAHPQIDPSPIRVSWTREAQLRSRGANPNLALDDPSVRLHVGDRVHFRMSHAGGRGQWFVCAVEIGPDARPRLLNTSEPDGHELRSGDAIELGRRPHRQRQGFELGWPATVPTDRPRPVTVLFLASPRPLQLGHLVPNARRDPIPRFEAPRRKARVRGHLDQPPPRIGPEPIREWSWQMIRYELDPRPATTEPSAP